MHIGSAFVLLGTALAAQAHMFGKDVQILDQKTFGKSVDGDKLTVAAFYAPWCGHCKNLAPEFSKAASNMKNMVNFAAVDCDDRANQGLCAQHGVRGFPTILSFAGTAEGKPYQGERTAKALVKHAGKRMPHAVQKLASAADVEKVQKESHGKRAVVLLTSSKTLSPLIKSLSAKYKKDFDFYAGRDETIGAAGVEVFAPEKLPALYIVDAERIVQYRGDVKYAQIDAWLSDALSAHTDL